MPKRKKKKVTVTSYCDVNFKDTLLIADMPQLNNFERKYCTKRSQ
jgi:hypothetical protein